VRAVLAKLADLPAEAEAEARTAEDLRAKLRAAERELGEQKRLMARAVEQKVVADPEALARARSEGEAAGAAGARRAIATLAASANAGRERAARALDQAMGQIKLAADALRETIDVPEMNSVGGVPRPPSTQRVGSASPASGRHPSPLAGTSSAASLRARGGESRMLAILAQHYPSGVTIGQWAALAALKRSGGTWSTYLSRLRTRGHVEERGGLWYATDAGVESAGVVPEQPSTPEEVLAMWEQKPGMGQPVRIVRSLLEHGGEMERDALAIACDLEASGGTYSTYLSRARTAGLITTDDGLVRAAETLLRPASR
jgi:hypothetical protein